MLIPGYDSGGSLVQVHKTFLTHAGEKADVPSVRKVDVGIGCNAFALELEEPTGDTLGVCEGVETAIGAMLFRPQVPVWPCYSAGVLANFTLPERLRGQVRKLVIYEDNDHCKNGLRAGQIAGSKLADRCRAQGLKYMIVRPAKTGDDMANHASRL
jgi:putative DNA primase/helicase